MSDERDDFHIGTNTQSLIRLAMFGYVISTFFRSYVNDADDFFKYLGIGLYANMVSMNDVRNRI